MLDKEETNTRKAVAAQARCRPFRLRPSGTGFIHIDLNASSEKRKETVMKGVGVVFDIDALRGGFYGDEA